MKRLFLFGILLITAGVVGALLTFPQYQTFQAQRIEVKQRERELENRETYFANLREVKAKLDEFPIELAKVRAAIPSDAQLPLLYEFLQATAAGSGVVLRAISTSVGGAGQTGLKTVGVSLEVAGSYSAFKEFLAQLQASPRMMAVQTMGLAGSEELDAFTFNVQLNTYSY